MLHCSGWVCYAEKTHGAYIIPHISTVRSPQQVMGVLVKKYFASVIGRSPDQIYHVAVMPCFDKKLESSRTQFLNVDDNVRDVDCVITSCKRHCLPVTVSFTVCPMAALAAYSTAVSMYGGHENCFMGKWFYGQISKACNLVKLCTYILQNCKLLCDWSMLYFSHRPL